MVTIKPSLHGFNPIVVWMDLPFERASLIGVVRFVFIGFGFGGNIKKILFLHRPSSVAFQVVVSVPSIRFPALRSAFLFNFSPL